MILFCLRVNLQLWLIKKKWIDIKFLRISDGPVDTNCKSEIDDAFHYVYALNEKIKIFFDSSLHELTVFRDFINEIRMTNLTSDFHTFP